MPDENTISAWTTQSPINQSLDDNDFVFDFWDVKSDNQSENSGVEMEGLQEERKEENSDSLHIDFGDENIIWEQSNDESQDISFKIQDDEVDEASYQSSDKVEEPENIDNGRELIDETSKENEVSLNNEWDVQWVVDDKKSEDGEYLENDKGWEIYQESENTIKNIENNAELVLIMKNLKMMEMKLN